MLETHMNSARTQTPLRIPWSRRSLVMRGKEERLLTSRMVKSSLLGKYLQRNNNIEDTVSIWRKYLITTGVFVGLKTISKSDPDKVSKYKALETTETTEFDSFESFLRYRRH